MSAELIAMARAAEKDERLSDGALYGKLANRIERLQTAVRMVLKNMGGHQHWDSFGTAGANCPICQRQCEASLQASEILNEKPA